MRTIKFRGKNAVTKNWYYGDCVHKLGKTYIVDVSSEYPVAVSEKTVGQFTGLRDKDGREIYEGDIFHLGDPRITYVVLWIDCGLKAKQIGLMVRFAA